MTPKPTGRRSIVWEHYEITEDKSLVKCKHCHRVVSIKHKSTGNLFRHLRRHSIDLSGNEKIDQGNKKENPLRENVYINYGSFLGRMF
ncbi:unnamed protein product [Leptosia nina]|uniref:BED-type domain-containing protein n=1 Tax=Leptosia nina TaxID=320188 RepID=A0AAV1K2I4_9NEOP